MGSETLDKIKELITGHEDWPKPGIVFRDIFPMLRNPQAFDDFIGLLVTHIKEKHCQNGEKVDVIVGLDARGFLFGPTIALRLGASFVPIRKKGKLPGKVESFAYKLEYGEDCFEIQKDSIQPGQRVVIVDDLMATGAYCFFLKGRAAAEHFRLSTCTSKSTPLLQPC